MTPAFTVAYDANGNTLSDATGKSYSWDFENRLVQAVVPGANGGTTTFKYDPFGRRIYKQSPSFTSVFLYDGGGRPILAFCARVGRRCSRRLLVLISATASSCK
jgi:YD repeat-containing protein